MKIHLFEDEKQYSEHETEPKEVAELFELAEKLTDKDMEKIARACKKMTQESK